MSTLRSTFILRCWRLPDGTARLAIEHVQSGDSAHVVTLTAAVEWLTGRTGVAQPAVGMVRADDIAPAEGVGPALRLADP
jgi:hypothetical protein